MDSNTIADGLPYVVRYQCKMCTHLCFDEFGKILSHLDKKHGTMINLHELRGIVYKNGQSMHGFSRLPKPKMKSDDEHRAELISPVSHMEDKDAKDEIDISQNVLPDEKNADTGVTKGTSCILHRGLDPDNEYTATNYQSLHQVRKFEHSEEDDDEEQLTDNGVDSEKQREIHSQNHFNHVDCQEDDNEVPTNHHVKNKRHAHGDEDEYRQQEEDYNEDGDIVACETGEEMDEDEGEEGPNATYNNGSNQTTGNLNHGFSSKCSDKFFTTKRGLESLEQHHKNQMSPHIRQSNEHTKFICKICNDTSFTTFNKLKLHVKGHNTSERIHICKFCFSIFNNAVSLTKHLIIHSRENPNKCHCGKTFVEAHTLKIHKKIHTGVKPFVCNFFQCGRAFVAKSTLKTHIRTHTGEKPYKCSFCPSSFTTNFTKYRHERNIHKFPEPKISQ